MGVFSVAIEIGDPGGERYESIDAVVDTGATYTVVPASRFASLPCHASSHLAFRVGGWEPERFRNRRDPR